MSRARNPLQRWLSGTANRISFVFPLLIRAGRGVPRARHAVTLQCWLAVALLLFHLAWFDRRVREDEARLARRFGEPYLDYLARVKRWIPGVI